MITLVTTFSDIFRNSFLETWSNQQINLGSVAICLVITAIVSLYIFFLYRIVTRKTFYSKNFNISLVGVALITAAIIVTIQSNIVISLGMVGALSIIRFRTAVKNPMDLMFLFWAVSVGIICGAGHSAYAICMSLVLTIAILVLDRIPLLKAPMIMVVNASDNTIESKILPIIKQQSKYAQVKARNMTANSVCLTIELRVADGMLVNQIQSVEGVVSVSLISHNGETTL